MCARAAPRSPRAAAVMGKTELPVSGNFSTSVIDRLGSDYDFGHLCTSLHKGTYAQRPVMNSLRRLFVEACGHAGALSLGMTLRWT